MACNQPTQGFYSPCSRDFRGRDHPAHPHPGVLSGRNGQVSLALLFPPAAAGTSTQVPQSLDGRCQNSLQPGQG